MRRGGRLGKGGSLLASPVFRRQRLDAMEKRQKPVSGETVDMTLFPLFKTGRKLGTSRLDICPALNNGTIKGALPEEKVPGKTPGQALQP